MYRTLYTRRSDQQSSKRECYRDDIIFTDVIIPYKDRETWEVSIERRFKFKIIYSYLQLLTVHTWFTFRWNLERQTLWDWMVRINPRLLSWLILLHERYSLLVIAKISFSKLDLREIFTVSGLKMVETYLKQFFAFWEKTETFLRN